MSRLPSKAVERLRSDLVAAQAAEGMGYIDRAWALLEEAHILSQPSALSHIRVHGAMFGLAWRQRDRAELRGQLLRLAVAGPGSLTGRYPVGNSGRSNVPATQPMPLPDELAELLAGDG